MRLEEISRAASIPGAAQASAPENVGKNHVGLTPKGTEDPLSVFLYPGLRVVGDIVSPVWDEVE